MINNIKNTVKIQHLTSDIFCIVSKDPDGKLYEKVSRLILQGSLLDSEIWLDFNSSLFSLYVGLDIYISLISISYHEDSQSLKASDYMNYTEKYEAFLVGRIFNFKKYSYGTKNYLIISASFGGYLMRLKIQDRYIKKISINSDIALGINRIIN